MNETNGMTDTRFCFSETSVYGDDFNLDQIKQWYEEEEYGYYNLEKSSTTEYNYIFDRLNDFHLYRFLTGRFQVCLAYGCARGDDIAPLAPRVGRFVAIEPAEQWWSETIAGTPITYMKPAISGDIRAADGTFDLLVCLNVLHHVANVTHVINEFGRVAAPGATFLFREPITSMGDWRQPRRGLTKNERGFPVQWLEKTLDNAGFEIRRRSLCMFPTTQRFAQALGFRSGYDNIFFVWQDALISKITAWNLHYHRDTFLKKFGPWAASYVLTKR
jgi:SAM-dependent methyltransferase